MVEVCIIEGDLNAASVVDNAGRDSITIPLNEGGVLKGIGSGHYSHSEG